MEERIFNQIYCNEVAGDFIGFMCCGNPFTWGNGFNFLNYS